MPYIFCFQRDGAPRRGVVESPARIDLNMSMGLSKIISLGYATTCLKDLRQRFIDKCESTCGEVLERVTDELLTGLQEVNGDHFKHLEMISLKLLLV